MVGTDILKKETLFIIVLGLLAFILDSAAGISVFPMAARVVQRMAHEEDFENYLLMHAMGANAAGRVADPG